MQSIKPFEEHKWRVDDLTAPVIEEPVLVFENRMYEEYLDYKGITEYYTEDQIVEVVKVEV